MNVYSMTGYGRSHFSNEDYKVSIEIKSVNHRYLDLNIRLPRFLNVFEQDIRRKISEYISRGKIDCFINYEDFIKKSFNIIYNKNIAENYYSKIKDIAKDFNLENNMTALAFSKMQDILTIDEEELNEEEIKNRIFPILEETLNKYNKTRNTEGEHLKENLLSKTNLILEAVEKIEKRAEQLTNEYRDSLLKKVDDSLKALKIEPDMNRVMQEVVIYSDKICIDEEIVRLKSHIKRFNDLLVKDSNLPSLTNPIGKELDFITQEMNREANTMLSKTADLQTSNEALTIKISIEKIREQVQNLE